MSYILIYHDLEGTSYEMFGTEKDLLLFVEEKFKNDEDFGITRIFKGMNIEWENYQRTLSIRLK